MTQTREPSLVKAKCVFASNAPIWLWLHDHTSTGSHVLKTWFWTCLVTFPNSYLENILTYPVWRGAMQEMVACLWKDTWIRAVPRELILQRKQTQTWIVNQGRNVIYQPCKVAGQGKTQELLLSSVVSLQWDECVWHKVTQYSWISFLFIFFFLLFLPMI